MNIGELADICSKWNEPALEQPCPACNGSGAEPVGNHERDWCSECGGAEIDCRLGSDLVGDVIGELVGLAICWKRYQSGVDADYPDIEMSRRYRAMCEAEENLDAKLAELL